MLINENLRRQNAKRMEHHFQVGHEVLVRSEAPTKLSPKFEGPFLITQVFTNGTVEIQRTPLISEKLNIRKIVPFRRI